MRIFISAGRAQWRPARRQSDSFASPCFPDARFDGFGGDKMAAAGANLRYPLVNLAVMWFLSVLVNLVTFIRLIFMADRYFREEKPDAVVLVDYPGLHWWIASRREGAGDPRVLLRPTPDLGLGRLACE